MLDDVVRAVTYVPDIDAYYAVADERYKYFDNSLPKNTLVAVNRLPIPICSSRSKSKPLSNWSG